MSVQVRRRRETAAFLSTFVGAQGELLIDTTNNRVQVHDGTTPGGFPAARLDEVQTPPTISLSGGGSSSQTASGMARPNSVVLVFRNGLSVGSALVVNSGAWSLPLSNLADGDVVEAASIPVAAATANVSATQSFFSTLFSPALF